MDDEAVLMHMEGKWLWGLSLRARLRAKALQTQPSKDYITCHRQVMTTRPWAWVQKLPNLRHEKIGGHKGHRFSHGANDGAVLMRLRQNFPKGKLRMAAKQGKLELPQAVLDLRFKPIDPLQEISVTTRVTLISWGE
jgi:hypothetical protein